MFPDNSWYSHRFILSQYINGNEEPTHCSIQHGSISVTFTKNFGKLRIPFSKYLIWNKKTAQVCTKNKNYNFEVIGSPFLYLDKMLNKSNFRVIKNSYFIILPHTSEMTLSKSFLHEQFIKYIEKKFKGKITVCVFFNDRDSKIENLYKKKKMNIFSCGKRDNKHFLYLLYYQLKKHENIVITQFGSALFYSLFLNKKTYFIDRLSPHILFNNKNQLEKYKKKYSHLFSRLPLTKIVNAKFGKKLADEELGLDYLKSPEEIKLIIWPNNFFLKIYTRIFQFLLYLKWRNKLLN